MNQYASIAENDEEPFVPTYDGDGNQTKIKTSTGIWTVAYNALNRPVRFTRTAEDGTVTTITADYDFMGRRVYKKVETTSADPETGDPVTTVTSHQRSLYRGYLQIAALDLTRSTLNAFWYILWDPTETVATRPLAIQTAGGWFTYGLDLTKNVTELYKSDGTIANAYAYAPFGGVTQTGNITNPLKWSSEVYDAELGMVYYNFRFYNPRDGRWTSRDPIGEEGGANVFEFVGGNVYGEWDQLGLAWDTIWDVGNLLWDAGVIITGWVTDDDDMVESGLTDLAADAVATAVPFLPAGASKISRAASRSKKGPRKTKNNGDKKKHKGKYVCTAKGGMIDLGGGEACCGWVTGVGIHKSESEAKKLAKKDAQNNTPRNCQAKHLNVRCVKH